MKIPWPLLWSGYLGTAAALAGVIVGLRRWPRLSRGQRIVASWLGVSATADLATYLLEPILRNTQPIAQVWFLGSVILGMEALGALQPERRLLLLFRAAAIAYACIWVVLAVSVESVHHYSTYAGPLQGFVLLGASLGALLRRVAVGRRDFLDDPAFLVCIAFASIGLLAAFQTLTARLLLNQNASFVTGYYTMNNVVNALAALVLLTALRLQPTRPPERAT